MTRFDKAVAIYAVGGAVSLAGGLLAVLLLAFDTRLEPLPTILVSPVILCLHPIFLAAELSQWMTGTWPDGDADPSSRAVLAVTLGLYVWLLVIPMVRFHRAGHPGLMLCLLCFANIQVTAGTCISLARWS